MKKLLFLLAITGVLSFTSCSEIPENNDPVIGIWSKVEVNANATSDKSTLREEWIFNDAYLGRYHSYESDILDVQTDFSWTVENEIYTISYPGTDKADDVASMVNSDEATILQATNGEVIAIRE